MTMHQEKKGIVLVVDDHLANLGDCKTLVIHPWSSQYISFTEESRRENGITPDLFRVYVGIEAIEDITEDIDQALKAI